MTTTYGRIIYTNMPTAKSQEQDRLVTLLLSGLAGWGKSSFAMCAPQPHAVLCVDKPICAQPAPGTPGYDPELTFWKSYPPPDTDLTNAKAKKPRNVADEIYKDLQTIKNALRAKQPTFDMDGEQWPLPRTLIVEGADFIAKHVENWVLAVNDKTDMTDWEDRFTGWRLRLSKLNDIYDLLTYLPQANLCNIVVTTGLDEESKMQKNERGKMELTKTGFVDPELGGKMSIEGPRKFANSFLCTVAAGKWWVVTKPVGAYSKFRGIRSGQFGMDDQIDVTVDAKHPINIWDKVFGS